MPAPSNEMDWTDQTVATLRTLWGEGHSTAEIGRRMDTTKNAIVGKAHRLKLPARPSPIRVASPDRPKPAPRITPPVLALPSPLPTVLLPPPAPEPPPIRRCLPGNRQAAGICQWPIGEPGRVWLPPVRRRACAGQAVLPQPLRPRLRAPTRRCRRPRRVLTESNHEHRLPAHPSACALPHARPSDGGARLHLRVLRTG